MKTDRLRGTIAVIETFHAFADVFDTGERYFIYGNAFQTTGRYGFAHLRIGSVVEFTPIEHPKGPRGIEVKILVR